MMFEVKPQALPMKEAQAFWRDKVTLGPGQFAKLSAEAKVKAFAISGIAKADELSTVFNALQRAIDDGISFTDFKRDCGDIFSRRGWTGKRAWRVDNIFRTNIQTAYSVGQYKQAKEDAETFPYVMYSAINDFRTRPTHLSQNGKVYPIDHPFWDQWWPPNGYRCRCTTISMTKGMVERRGLTVQTDDPTGTPVMAPGEINPRQLLPDPGFAHHPGKVAWGGLVDDALGKNSALQQLQNLPGHAEHKLPAARNLKKLPTLPELLPDLATLKADGMSNKQAASFYQEQFRAMFGIQEGAELPMETAPGPVIISERLIVGQGGRVKITKGGREQYVPLFHRTITDPDEVWLTPMKTDNGQYVLRQRRLSFWRDERNPDQPGTMGGFSVLDIDRGVASGVTIYDVGGLETWPDGENKLDGSLGYRRGLLLYRKKK